VRSPAARAIAACAACTGFALCACNRAPPIASCDDDLRGVYATDRERWMILDSGATLEAYPLFPDGAVTSELVSAPRVIDLERPGNASLRGTLHQRFMRRAERCDAEVRIQISRCAGDTLELVLSDPSPPLRFSPCEWPRPGTSRVVRWRRE
jgi:hypothetical protein